MRKKLKQVNVESTVFDKKKHGMKSKWITFPTPPGISTVESHSSRDVYFSLIEAPSHGDVIMSDGFDKIKVKNILLKS